jgi:hypothetical protein
MRTPSIDIILEERRVDEFVMVDDLLKSLVYELYDDNGPMYA